MPEPLACGGSDGWTFGGGADHLGANWKATRFLEGNRGLRQPARDDCPAVGTAGRASGSPASPRQARLNLCVARELDTWLDSRRKEELTPATSAPPESSVSPGPLPAPPSLVALATSPIPLRRARRRTPIARRGVESGARRVPAAGPPGRRTGYRKEPARDGIRAVGGQALHRARRPLRSRRSCLSRRSSPCFNGSSG